MSDFVSFPLLGFTLVIKLRNFDLKGHSNTFIFFIKRDMVSDLNMSHRKMSDFVSFPLFDFTLIIKLRNFDFKGHTLILKYILKYFNIFLNKKWYQVLLCLVK